jgi:hypothetical protein
VTLADTRARPVPLGPESAGRHARRSRRPLSARSARGRRVTCVQISCQACFMCELYWEVDATYGHSCAEHRVGIDEHAFVEGRELCSYSSALGRKKRKLSEMTATPRRRRVAAQTRSLSTPVTGGALRISGFVKRCPTPTHIRRRGFTCPQTWADVEQRLTGAVLAQAKSCHSK